MRHPFPSVFLAHRTGALALVAFIAALFCPAAQAGQDGVAKSEVALGRTVGNYRLVDQDGRYLPFFKLKGKPVLLSFIYADCPDACPLINQSIAKLLKGMPKGVSSGISVLSVTLDPVDDKPEKLKSYSNEFREFTIWSFVTTDEATLRMMVSDLGFTYEQKDGEIAHMNRLTLLDPSGKVVRHFYGTEFNRSELEGAITTLIEGRTLSDRFTFALDKLMLYCSRYDPAGKTYKVDFKIVAVWGLQFFLILATAVFFLVQRLRRTN